MIAGRSTAVLAHGLGGSADLPIPYTYALIGAAWALTFTFAVVALAWRKPRFDPAKPGRPLPARFTTVVDAPVTRWAVAVAALLFAAWVAVAAVFGPQDDQNPLLGVFYVLLWVGLVALSLAVGPVWRALSPVRTLYRLTPLSRRPPPSAYPPRLGYWPAALGLFAFVWLELASPDPGSLAAVKIWLLLYLAVTLAGALVFGIAGARGPTPSRCTALPRRDCRRCAATPTAGSRSAIPSITCRRCRSGRGPSRCLPCCWDRRRSTASRRCRSGATSSTRHAVGVPLGAVAIRTVGLLVFAAVVGVTFRLAARATGGVDRATRRRLPGLMAHSLIPIVIGYVFAHYLTYLVERGQQTVIQLADPLGRGWNPLGLGDAQVSYVLSMHPTVLATLKVCFVLGGHIAGVIAAHDQALWLLPKRHQVTGQLAMMLVMVGYTFTGLYLLFGG